jgi:CBS domain-containing protein
VEVLRHVPIVDDDQQLLGLVSQHDVICANHSFFDGSLDQSLKPEAAQAALEQSMVAEVCTTTPGSSLRQAALVLQGHKYGCLPVIDEGQLAGIISGSDFVGVAINLLQQHEEISDEVEAGEDLEVDQLDDLGDLYIETEETDDWERADL